MCVSYGRYSLCIVQAELVQLPQSRNEGCNFAKIFRLLNLDNREMARSGVDLASSDLFQNKHVPRSQNHQFQVISVQLEDQTMMQTFSTTNPTIDVDWRVISLLFQSEIVKARLKTSGWLVKYHVMGIANTWLAPPQKRGFFLRQWKEKAQSIKRRNNVTVKTPVHFGSRQRINQIKRFWYQS